MRGLKGKTFLIAGGATGIGAATAERLANEGASVAIGDINIGGATATSSGSPSPEATPLPSNSTLPTTSPCSVSST